MDCRVWQKAHRLYFLRPWRRASSSHDGPANEPSAEILGCRGGARSQEVRQGIFTTDEGSPHLEWHRRFGSGEGDMGKLMSKSVLIQRMAGQQRNNRSRNDVKNVMESLAKIGYKELKKAGAFLVPGFAKLAVIKKPATKERSGINPFTN